jgi:alkanesulfonate monooxygenase SsuD/methylene tetrahydromethanopterin reductase-like flavin-dependent oxidoreductase (luciferase family)
MRVTQGIGLVIGSSVGPESLAETAQLAEKSGFGELWLAEDFFFTGGISGANIALAATETIQVGLGVVSAVVRHPALLAMEIATTARAYPGRFTPGIGLGVPAWMRQMGLLPASPLTAVRECVASVRRLLDGETVDENGRVFTFDQVELVYPATGKVPIHLGVIGPKMLEMSGEIADGSILSVASGVDYIKWARERIDAGREKARRGDGHRVTVFAIYAVDGDGERSKRLARETLAFYKTAGGRNALTDAAGISDDLEDMAARGGVEAVTAEMPESWVEALTIAGTPDEVVGKIETLRRAGADSVCLFPATGEGVTDTIALTAEEVLPRLG